MFERKFIAIILTLCFPLLSSSCGCPKNFLAFDLPDKMVEFDPITGKVNKINPEELGAFLKEITTKGRDKLEDNYTVRVDFSHKNATVTQPGIVSKGTQLLDRARNAIKAKAPQPNIYQGSGMFCILSRKPDQQISNRHAVHLVVLLEEAFFGIHNMSQLGYSRFVEVAKVFVLLIENYKIGRSRLEFNVNGSQSQYGVHFTIASELTCGEANAQQHVLVCLCCYCLLQVFFAIFSWPCLLRPAKRNGGSLSLRLTLSV